MTRSDQVQLLIPSSSRTRIPNCRTRPRRVRNRTYYPSNYLNAASIYACVHSTCIWAQISGEIVPARYCANAR